jgi:hypothetical protein
LRDGDVGSSDVPAIVDKAQQAAFVIVKAEMCVLWNLISGGHIHKVAALMENNRGGGEVGRLGNERGEKESRRSAGKRSESRKGMRLFVRARVGVAPSESRKSEVGSSEVWRHRRRRARAGGARPRGAKSGGASVCLQERE